LSLDPSLLSSASTLIEPLQDWPQTASALKLWRRANRLWCNTVTGGLHRPLGKWLVPSPQLRRVWPFYFDPDMKTLWSRTGEGFNVHSCISFGRNWRTTQFHLPTNRHATTLPSNSFPVECHETTTRLIITSQNLVVMSVLVYLNLLADLCMAPIATIEIYIYTNSESNVKQITQKIT
jgi:hypothetical protein